MTKKLISIGVLASALCGLAVFAAQDTGIERVEVRDPVRLEAFLEANAADAESRLAAIEATAVGGALDAGKIIVGNVTNIAEAQAMSGAATIDSNGVVTLTGNIPVARLTNALATTISSASTALQPTVGWSGTVTNGIGTAVTNYQYFSGGQLTNSVTTALPE